MEKEIDAEELDRQYLGNIYGLHDGYDGSVFNTLGVAKGIVSSEGGVSCIIQIYKVEKNKLIKLN